MKFKKFINADMGRLMAQIKKELGDDAAIISSSTLPDGQNEVIAAIEVEDNDGENLGINDDWSLRQCLHKHAFTTEAITQILAGFRNLPDYRQLNDNVDILTACFNHLLKYGQFFDDGQSVKMFIGSNGSGKTSTLLKIAALARMRGIPLSIIGTDNIRAGASEQLKHFADILKADFATAFDCSRLFDKILSAQSEGHLTLIDTFGVNPFCRRDMEKLEQICHVISCDRVVTINANGNSEDTLAGTLLFKQIGANWLFPTGLDACHSLGCVISSAILSGLRLEYAGVGSPIYGGLARMSNEALARLIAENK